MKVTICIILFLAVANSQLMSPKFKQFMQLKQEAGFAVDAVMDVLNGLRQSALDEREALDNQHDADKASFAKRIADLTTIMNTNRAMFDAAIANRQFVEQEIVNTANYIDFINNRFKQIDALVAELQEQRCDAAKTFVTRIREHYEAMEALAFLRHDLKNWEASGMPVSLAEIKKKKSFAKLSAYTHLFKQNAIKNFIDLANTAKHVRTDKVGGVGHVTNAERRHTAGEIGDDHVDNTRGKQVIEHQVSTRDNTEETVIGKLMVRLDKFEAHLKASMHDLIQAEIRAGRDTVAFIQESEKEVHVLQVELDKYTAYAAKLENDIVLAKQLEAESDQAWQLSVQAVKDAKAELAACIKFYMSEVDRLKNDVEVVDEVIKIFLQELKGIDDIIRNQQYDQMGVVDDKRFSKGVFRTADTDAGKYTGQGNWEGKVASTGTSLDFKA